MRFRIMIPATLALLLIGCTAAEPTTTLVPSLAPSATSQKAFLEKIDELLPGMGAEKLVDRKDSQMAFERICFDNSAPGKEKERAALCKAMMQRVGADVAMPARVWLLRKVESIGREEVVSRLSELLRDKELEIRELARRALQNNPVSQAGAVLRDELRNAKCPLRREKMINALAFRRDGAAVEIIAADIGASESALANAAVAAMGEIGTAPAIKILKTELDKRNSIEAGSLLVDACLRGAERAVARGDNKAAMAMYSAIQMKPVISHAQTAGAETQVMAAMAGIASIGGPDAVRSLLGTIVPKEAPHDEVNMRLQIAAASFAENIPGEAATKQLADAIATASPDSQAILLDILGKRGDRTAAQTVLKYADATDANARIAAIGALRSVGDGTMVEMLAKRAAGATGEERDVIRDSINGMKGSDVDAEIMRLITTAQDRVKAELARAAAVRLTKPAYDHMLDHADDSDETVRVAVIAGIGKIAKQTDLPRVLKVLASASDETTLSAAKEALVQICARTGDADERTAPLIQAMKAVEPPAQAIAVRALATLKGTNALLAIRDALKSDREVVSKAAADALESWGPFVCLKWEYAGPFRKEGAKAADLFDIEFPPEDAQAKVEWKNLKKVKGVEIKLDQIEEKAENCCAYIRAKIVSDKDQDVELVFGSDDGIKAWLNGEIVNAKNVSRPLKNDDDQVSAKLKKGENTLMIKVTQGDKEWKAAFGIKAPEGGPPPDVTCPAK